MTVRLMLTCLCDAFYGDVGVAAVKVLEHAGCTVEFPADQTCCGQPPFNAGDWAAARTIAGRTRQIFAGDTPVVTPSGSCAAMVRHGYGELFSTPSFPCFELCEYLVRVMEIDRWPLRATRVHKRRKIAFHNACHGRVLGLGSLQIDLVKTIPWVDIVSTDEGEQCCGFGGAFAATHGAISEGIGLRKLECLMASGATEIVSGDMGCLTHLNGLIERNDLPIRTKHVAQVLAEAIG